MRWPNWRIETRLGRSHYCQQTSWLPVEAAARTTTRTGERADRRGRPSCRAHCCAIDCGATGLLMSCWWPLSCRLDRRSATARACWTTTTRWHFRWAPRSGAWSEKMVARCRADCCSSGVAGWPPNGSDSRRWAPIERRSWRRSYRSSYYYCYCLKMTTMTSWRRMMRMTWHSWCQSELSVRRLRSVAYCCCRCWRPQTSN